MNLLALDFIIIAVLLVSATLSLIRGFTSEVLSVGGWIIAGYMAIFLGPLVKPLLAPYISLDWAVNIGAMLIVFLVTLVMFSLLSNAIAQSLKASGIGALDRSLGVLFGVGRGLFIIALGYFVTVLVVPEDQHPDWIANARLRPMLQTSTKFLVAVVPMDRLPLNITNIEGLIRDNADFNKKLDKTITQTIDKAIDNTIDGAIDKTRALGKKAVRDALDSELQNLAPDTKQDDEDETGYKSGYKKSERNSMERLIKNSEGVE